MVEVCYAWNDGLDGHSAERMTSGRQYVVSSFATGLLLWDCASCKCRASKIEQPQTNRRSTGFPAPHADGHGECVSHKEGLSPWNPAAAQLQDVFGLEL